MTYQFGGGDDLSDLVRAAGKEMFIIQTGCWKTEMILAKLLKNCVLFSILILIFVCSVLLAVKKV